MSDLGRKRPRFPLSAPADPDPQRRTRLQSRRGAIEPGSPLKGVKPGHFSADEQRNEEDENIIPRKMSKLSLWEEKEIPSFDAERNGQMQKFRLSQEMEKNAGGQRMRKRNSQEQDDLDGLFDSMRISKRQCDDRNAIPEQDIIRTTSSSSVSKRNNSPQVSERIEGLVCQNSANALLKELHFERMSRVKQKCDGSESGNRKDKKGLSIRSPTPSARPFVTP